jgi:hypothetical protein
MRKYFVVGKIYFPIVLAMKKIYRTSYIYNKNKYNYEFRKYLPRPYPQSTRSKTDHFLHDLGKAYFPRVSIISILSTAM